MDAVKRFACTPLADRDMESAGRTERSGREYDAVGSPLALLANRTGGGGVPGEPHRVTECCQLPKALKVIRREAVCRH